MIKLFKRKYGTTKFIDHNGHPTMFYNKRDKRHPNFNHFKFDFLNKLIKKKDKTWSKSNDKWLTEYVLFNLIIIQKYEIFRGNGCRLNIIDTSYKIKLNG